jgi:hypothetical protein
MQKTFTKSELRILRIRKNMQEIADKVDEIVAYVLRLNENGETICYWEEESPVNKNKEWLDTIRASLQEVLIDSEIKVSFLSYSDNTATCKYRVTISWE